MYRFSISFFKPGGTLLGISVLAADLEGAIAEFKKDAQHGEKHVLVSVSMDADRELVKRIIVEGKYAW